MHRFTLSLCGLAVAAAFSQTALASQQSEAQGFIQDSSFNLLNRAFYFNREFRNGGFNGAGTNANKPGQENGFREEAAYGIMGFFESGFTQGTVGLGVDAYGFLGIRLDSGGGRTGGLIAPIGNDGKPENDWSEAGGVVKLRVSNTVLKIGEQQVENPMVATGDARLIPETATGIFLSSEEVGGLSIDAGRITSMNAFDGTNSDGDLLIQYNSDVGSSVGWVGFNYAATDELSVSLFASEVEETWRRYYANTNYTIPFNDDNSLNIDFNIYRTNGYGDEKAGKFNDTTWSLRGKYSFGAHALSAAVQQVNGDSGFDYIGFNAIYLANSMQYSDFNSPGEESMQVRYDLDMSSYGVPGLTFMTSYTFGGGIDSQRTDPNSAFAGADGKHWERDIDVQYVVQEGVAKDLSLRARYATHRGSSDQIDGDVDELRLIVEYPLSLL